MPSLLPLITHHATDATFAYLGNTPISVARFLAEAAEITEQLPPGRHVLNLCRDRYSFSVTFAACIISGRISLLPSTHTTDMVGQMQRIAPDVFCIRTQDSLVLDLPTFVYLTKVSTVPSPTVIPQIASDQIIVQVFTSGSTGLPIPHCKRWGSLVRNVQAAAQRLQITAAYALLGTVPAQHMYGLESTVLLPFQSGATLHAGRPFYPADICTALEELPRPRLLVTTPYHLHILLTSQLPLPAVDLLLSATAPLTTELAQEAERRFSAPLFEIYGCTETGQLASRRTVDGSVWQTFSQVHMRHDGHNTWAEGGHIDIATCLSDIVEIIADETDCTNFRLHGRNTDMVNIAGKRTSLAYLNYHLNAIPGVQDGVFLLPNEEAKQPQACVTRLIALVVAPQLERADLLAALRQRIDQVFLPRPLLFVDILPRNATGKLSNQHIQNLLANLGTSSV